jgi:thymidylate synthase
MSKIDKTYNDLLNTIIRDGFLYEDPNRKGVKRKQIPHYSFEHDFAYGFPAITTKKLYWKGIVTELLWFLRGDTSTKFLVDNGVNIWNKDGLGYVNRGDQPEIDLSEYVKNVKDGLLDGSLGRVYGVQWRNFAGLSEDGKSVKFNDQISNLIAGLKETPMATRHIVNAWNPSELGEMALPPCHWSFEVLVQPLTKFERELILKENSYDDWYITKKSQMESLFDSHNIPKYGLTLKWHQRSVDTFLGLPFNIASYALLAEIIASLTGMKAKGVVADLSNVHIYEPHMPAVIEQLARAENKFWQPLKLEPIDGFTSDMDSNIDECLKSKKIKDFKIIDYKSHEAIKADMIPYDA